MNDREPGEYGRHLREVAEQVRSGPSSEQRIASPHYAEAKAREALAVHNPQPGETWVQICTGLPVTVEGVFRSVVLVTRPLGDLEPVPRRGWHELYRWDEAA